VIEIYEFDETELDRIRRKIYDGERRGVQQKVGELFRRYFSTDFEFRPNQQREGVESVGNRSNDGYGGRSGGETSSTEEGVNYSLEDMDEAPSKQTKKFLDAIEDLRNGKQNASDKLAKYVYTGKGF